MKRIALFPGSFDPITKGHEAIVKRGLKLFDEIIVAVGINSNKQNFFDLEKRKQMVAQTFKSHKNVRIESYEGLTIDFCKKMKANFILRGLRSNADFEYETNIAQMNSALSPTIETVFILTSPELSAISSTVVRDVLRYKGNATQFLPQNVRV
ncbi:MAG TPA: pantetheine-phosphate adenylyltransferase [Bacteroidia bacterium]|nr:pantetheine-phosphate adenylyltransferase [Bacteroidia bacterium]HRH08033.1 pantetheine-phosphate adenylyltransferase [Bacteroidia bacterium]HRH61741.1 pantetheine-phosphate adenylyltransferase [Bacteroidia bacterium]